MRYRILGPTEAHDDTGAPRTPGGARLRALLTALALRAGAPAAASVTDLVDEVWGDDPPRDAPAALQALVSRLRRALGAGQLTTDPVGGYRLTADRDDVDLHRFTRLAALGAEQLAGDPGTAATTLREALALWRGRALTDLPEPARTTHAAACEARRARAQRDRVEADLRCGATAPAELLPEIEALIQDHPYDEPLRAQQIRALRAAGRPADALAAYERTRRDLAEGLGADPGPALRALHAELLRSPSPQSRGNIRPRLTSFVGREPELAALAADLDRVRLVTLTGPGGSGKTRLAEHAAAARPDSGWLVELARLDHPAAVPGAVLSALGLRENSLVARERTTADDDPTAALVEHCAHRRLLLVLDNCEHVIGAAAELAERLLTHCPGVRILATSREPLGVPGEFLRPLEPLPPAPAHRLFADRAAAARPGFRPGDDPAAVAEICARLDGLPLAIELAAARLRLLTPRQIADRLDDRFRLLTGGARTLLPRQQTLRAVVDWSWDLLGHAERTVLARLSAFAGGCDLEAAEAVCADDTTDPAGTTEAPAATKVTDVAEAMAALVDKSLVQADPGPDGMRYRLLETIHEYAAERLAADPADARATARRHAAHYAALAERAEPLLRSAGQLPWIRRVEAELDNLRSALHTTTGGDPDDGDTETAQRLLSALGWFWWLRDYRAEGAEWTARLLARIPAEPPEDSPDYWPHMRLRMLHMFLRAESTGPQWFRTPEHQAVALRLKEVFRRGTPEATRFPGMLWPTICFLTGDIVGFHTSIDESIANCRRQGGEWELAIPLLMRTHFAIDTTGGLSTADTDLTELQDLAHRVGDRWIRAQVASAAGEAALSRSQYATARAAYEECLRLAREVGARIEAPFAIARIAETAYREGDFDTAERLLAEADREAHEHGGVYDVSAFARFLSATLALQRGDHDRARAECAAARTAGEQGSVAAQFTAGLGLIEAVLEAREHGARAGLARIGPVFAGAVEAHCAERVLAGIAESASLFLADAGRPEESVRVLAAATAWRAGLPRPVPEEAALEGLPERTRAALGAAGQARAEAEGRTLTPGEVLAVLGAVTEAAGLSRS
ncbi:BTAD domain-containing putative transcriptional regulator [Streptomyces sp. NPDC012794]|uniref:BTAD domain-containing putative transcriptional regulator n=1 Tax=Streptomyces sp. NPDC012794 TaxID=3364850 RepID=UPI0036A8E270